MTTDLRAVFDAFPATPRRGLLRLRRLILDVAEDTAGAGPVAEALRWGQPAFIAPHGATIRLGMPKTGGFALYVTCSTSLIEDFRPIAPQGMRFEGTRAVLFSDEREIDETALRPLIRAALMYHHRV